MLTLASMWLLSRKSRCGWLVAILGQLLWLPYDLATSQYGFILITAVSVPVYVRGWINFTSPGRYDVATETAAFTTLYSSQLPSSAATLVTGNATYGNVVQRLIAYNADSSARTVTLTLVRKGGTSTDSYAEPICAALSVAAGGAADLLANEQNQSALDELQLQPGDTLYGNASVASQVTLLVLGA